MDVRRHRHVSTAPMRTAAAGFAIVVVMAACTGATTPHSAASATAPHSPAAAASPTPLPTATPHVIPADAAPAELQGKWETVVGANESATLRLGETSYLISRGGNPVGGRISVEGNKITFKDSSACEGGVGTYTWAITDGVLTFTPTGERDPCPRVEYLIGTTFTRV